MSSYIAADVVCPFYCRDQDNYITCEGVEDDTRIHLVCENKKKRYAYQRRYCCEDFHNCRIASMLWGKYQC